MKFICINLKRRTDRRDKMINIFGDNKIPMEYMDAVDGLKLRPDKELLTLFKYNDFGFQRGIIGCALSHINIWQRLIKDDMNDYYLVLEDDIEIANDFMDKIQRIEQQMKKDNLNIVYIGDSSKSDNRNLVFDMKDMTLEPLPITNWHGGTYGYVISKECAKDLLDAVQHHSVHRAIDYFMVDVFYHLDYHLRGKMKVINQPLVYTQTALLNNEVDSDIQREKSTLI